MGTRNFYTPNGWEGSNYTPGMKMKDIAAKVRQYAKEKYPDYVFSITAPDCYKMRIQMKAGPCAPFVGGESGGYISTIAECVSGYEKDLVPGAYAALRGVCAYLQSFNYDDSDAMIDYFDTYFYTYVIVDSRDYKVREPRPAKPVKAVSGRSDGLCEVVEYSAKAVAVFGDTKAVKGLLKELGGRFNPALTYNGERRAGWIFSKRMEEKVRAAMSC